MLVFLQISLLILPLSFISIHPVESTAPKFTLLPYEVIYTWKQVDYAFNSDKDREEALKSQRFVPINNAITGIKVSGGRIFMTVPRWRSGVPATLTYLPYDPSKQGQILHEPKLIPFPNWDMQKLGQCSALQYIQSMEIDQYDRIWVIDVGRVNIFESNPDNKCPPKLLLIDLKTDKVVKTYEFPKEVVSRTNNFLNDLVVTCYSKEDCTAYISDASDSRLIIYSLGQGRSWYARHKSMKLDQTAVDVHIQGKKYNFPTAMDGIAISPKSTNFHQLYYNPLSSRKLFSIETSTLLRVPQGVSGVDLEDKDVRTVGTRSSQIDGMTVDANGILYFGLLEISSVNSWNTSLNNLTPENTQILAQSDKDLQWPDTFSIDDRGYLYTVTNKLHQFLSKTYDFTDTNFQVVRFNIGVKSYMFPPK